MKKKRRIATNKYGIFEWDCCLIADKKKRKIRSVHCKLNSGNAHFKVLKTTKNKF